MTVNPHAGRLSFAKPRQMSNSTHTVAASTKGSERSTTTSKELTVAESCSLSRDGHLAQNALDDFHIEWYAAILPRESHQPVYPLDAELAGWDQQRLHRQAIDCPGYRPVRLFGHLKVTVGNQDVDFYSARAKISHFCDGSGGFAVEMECESSEGSWKLANKRILSKTVFEHAVECITLTASLGATDECRARCVDIHHDRLTPPHLIERASVKPQESILRKQYVLLHW
ncbi:hypothetical protein MRB53_038348 [Persea americana]|nr:hypothetical protein MRB53_038348 [Persea americana]